jgi:hypothetical protein
MSPCMQTNPARAFPQGGMALKRQRAALLLKVNWSAAASNSRHSLSQLFKADIGGPFSIPAAAARVPCRNLGRA